jgi:plastocyanin
MRAARGTLLVTSLLTCAGPATAGTVQGRVQLAEKGGRPPGDLTNAVIWLEGPQQQPAKPAAASVTMRGKAFEPRVTVIPLGGSVSFPNDDPVFHNVFSLSGKNRFDLGLYKRPKQGAYTFTHTGLVRVYCNIHPQMSAFVLVLDTALWARPAADGAFSIAGVPPGRWTVRVWHERGGEATQPIEVGEAQPTTLAVQLDASRYREAPHTDKDGRDYSRRTGY